MPAPDTVLFLEIPTVLETKTDVDPAFRNASAGTMPLKYVGLSVGETVGAMLGEAEGSGVGAATEMKVTVAMIFVATEELNVIIAVIIS